VAVLPGGSLDPTGGSADRLRLPFTAEPPVISAAVAALAAAWRAFGAESTRRPLVPSMSV
jgi:hypothetical protein